MEVHALLEKLPAGSVELFALMSRVEFALKENGWGRAGRDDAVEVHWDFYANEGLGRGFLLHVRRTKICPTLLARPPSLQVLRGASLDWEGTAPPKSVQDLMGAVRRVRNNLFHGGKGGTPDRDRDAALIVEAVAVLRAALDWDADLLARFKGEY